MQSLVDQEVTNDYEWAFASSFAAAGKYPNVIFSDADLAVEAALPTCIPDGVHHLWCFFHILMNAGKNSAPIFGEVVEDIIRDLQQVHQATDVMVAEALWGRLVCKWGGGDPEVRMYLESMGGDKLAKWRIDDDRRPLRILQHGVQLFLNKRSTLVKVMEELLARASYEAMVRVRNRVKCETSWAEYGRTSRSAFPSVYDEAYGNLTSYAVRLLSKQAVRCAIYDVEAGTRKAF